MDSKQASVLTMLGGLVMAAGSLLSWAKVSGAIGEAIEAGGDKASQTGIGGGDGWITLVLGIALVAVGYMAYSGKGLPMWFGWTAAGLGLAIAVFEFFSLKSDADDINALIAQTGLDGSASVGIGYWLVAVGAVVGAVGVVMGRSPKTTE